MNSGRCRRLFARNWNERTPGHVESFGAVEFAETAGAISDIVEFYAAALAPFLAGGSIRGQRLIHAEVDIRYVESNVYHAAAAVDGRYDIVYTSVGVLAWLPRLDTWATTIAELLEPGGTFYVREGHPFLEVIAGRSDELMVVDRPYFNTGEPARYEDEVSYAGSAIRDSHENHQWSHSMSEIIQSLLDARTRNPRLRRAARAAVAGVPLPGRDAGRMGAAGTHRAVPAQPQPRCLQARLTTTAVDSSCD